MKIVRAILAEISRVDLKDLVTPVASITDVKHLASYNWIEAPTPTIVILGSPPVWSPPTLSRPLKKDSGLIYIAQNAARHPDSPLEPLFRALYLTHPLFDIRPIDIVSDRNNIRKFLSFVNPDASGKELETFTIRIELTKNTAIFCREETAAQDFIGPNEFRGFGHEFKRAYTTSQISGSTGHRRIISYRFGGLDFIVRHETDGYVETSSKMSYPQRIKTENGSLSEMLESLTLSSTQHSPNMPSPWSKLTIREAGRVVPLESTLAIKTRVTGKVLGLPEIAPQLWVSQTPRLLRAYHNNGKFQTPDVETVTALIKRWEDDNQKYLRKLAALVKQIFNIAKETGGNIMVKYDFMKDKLLVSKADGSKLLPDDLYFKWNGGWEYDTSDDRDHHTLGGSETKSLARADQNSTHVPFQVDVPFRDIIDYGVRNGFRHFFRRMPVQLSDYSTLCQSLEFLAIDTLEGPKMRDIMSDMRRGKSEWDPHEWRKIDGLKSLARDSAFRLLYKFLRPTAESDATDANMAYNATQFVVSHCGIFKYRARKLVRESFEKQFHVSDKQRKGLDKWPIWEEGRQESDVTTEEEDMDFDSDFSF